MTYQDLFICNNLLSNIPSSFFGKTIPPKTFTEVLLLQVSYQNKAKVFDDFMQEVLKKLKKEGFDERAQKVQRMEDIDNRLKAHDDWKEGDKDADGKDVPQPAKPSDEELKEADEIRETKADFDKELEELNTAYMDAYQKKSKEEVKELKLLSKETFESLVSFFGFTGNVDFTTANGDKVSLSTQDFLKMIALNAVSLNE